MAKLTTINPAREVTVTFCHTHQARDGKNAWGEPDTCPDAEAYVFVTSFDGAAASFGTYRAEKVRACPSCSTGRCLTDGEWSTGEKLLSGYTPAVGELVANHYSRCVVCGWEQAS